MDPEDKGVSLKDIGLEPRSTALLPRPDTSLPEPSPNGHEFIVAQETVKDAVSIEESILPHEKEAFKNAETIYNSVEDWVYRRIITPEQGKKLLLAAIAKGEIGGLKDPKTPLLNQIGFVDRLAHQISRVQRTNETLSMLYVDLEGFKQVNDTLGHDVGDIILELTGEFIKQHIRGDDEAARLGGDEFGISGTEDKNQNSTDTDESPFRKRLEDIFSEQFEPYIKTELEKRRIPTNVIIGARIGYAEYKSGEDVKAFIKKADTDMNSKRNPNSSSR